MILTMACMFAMATFVACSSDEPKNPQEETTEQESAQPGDVDNGKEDEEPPENSAPPIDCYHFAFQDTTLTAEGHDFYAQVFLDDWADPAVFKMEDFGWFWVQEWWWSLPEDCAWVNTSKNVDKWLGREIVSKDGNHYVHFVVQPNTGWRKRGVRLHLKGMFHTPHTFYLAPVLTIWQEGKDA